MQRKFIHIPVRSWMPYLLFTALFGGVLIYSVFLVKELKNRERTRMEILIETIRLQQSEAGFHPEIQHLLLKILQENDQMPMIITTEDKKPILEPGYYRNIDPGTAADPEAMQALVTRMGEKYPPVELKISDSEFQYVFFDNSKLLNGLQLFPYFLGFFIFVYIGFSVWIFKVVRRKNEGYLWAGFAKETAHQIGTPLSSLIGWTEVLAELHPEISEINEMRTDVNRLTTISERFSKIGSHPELTDRNLTKTIRDTCAYLKPRISGKIDFVLDIPSEDIVVSHNSVLIGWVLENLVRNGADAMKGSGTLTVKLSAASGGKAQILVSDTGCGMTAGQARQVFQAGYSTKRRGWGIGLSLVKRVVENIHHGEVSVYDSAPGRGSTFRVLLPREEKV